MVPSIAVIPREASFALAFFGKIRKVQEALVASAGRKSFVLNRVLEAALDIFLGTAERNNIKFKAHAVSASNVQHQRRSAVHCMLLLAGVP
jgi:hypothetical protein